jgi:methionyl-tRNA synthetase
MFPQLTPFVIVLLIPVIIWSLVWKGVALWKAARNGHTAWFVALLILNTVGLLEIIYIVFFSTKNSEKKTENAADTSVAG